MVRRLSFFIVSCVAGLIIMTSSHELEAGQEDDRGMSETNGQQTEKSHDESVHWLYQIPLMYRLHIFVWILCGTFLYKTYKQKKLGKGSAGKDVSKEEKKEAVKGKDAKKGNQKSVQKEESTAEAPAMPQFKLSQILPMIAAFALQKFDLQEMGYVRHVEVMYVVSQLACCCCVGLLYNKINALKDDGKKIQIPEVKVMGQVAAPASKQTPKEYDLSKWKEQMKRIVMGFFISGGIYYKWAMFLPIVMNILLAPLQLYESPLFRIHILGAEVSRPFPAENLLGNLFPAAENSKAK